MRERGWANIRNDTSALELVTAMERVSRRLEFKLSIGFVHPGGLMLGWFMGQMMEQGFRRLGCAS
jgi:hypothetical protein